VPKNLRVYELARELGLTNRETLDLCDALGIGVKSHSSSIVDAQADRVRRKADREGLIRDEQPEDPAETKKKAAAAKKAAAKKAATEEKAASEKTAAAEQDVAAKAAAAKNFQANTVPANTAAVDTVPANTVPANTAAVDTASVGEQTEAEPTPEAERGADSGPAVPAAKTGAAPEPAVASKPDTGPAADVAPERPLARSTIPSPPQMPPPRPLVTSSGQEGVRPTVEEAPAPKARSAPERRPVAQPPKEPLREAPAAKSIPRPPAAPPTSADGKPIPPPPAPPRSSSGKPIPPPPGAGGRGGAPTRSGSSRPSGAGFSGQRRGPAPSGPRDSVPGAGVGRGGPGGGRPGGPGGGGPRRPRRSKRRRRQMDELQPQELPSYTPDDAPVPEGEIVIERGSTAQDMAPRLNRGASDVVRFLLQQGEMVTASQSLTDDMIELFAVEIGAEVRLVDPGTEQEEELQRILAFAEADLEGAVPRGPVITVMGHVDHGKTLLLDRFRDASVAEGEAGGITQHIGAYEVEKDGKKVTFVDTPGHAAFTAMRARGAQSTDIVILVVAADDGIMPQTKEAIEQAKAAEVPIVVAMNKIDRDSADQNRVLAQLAEAELIPESYGGDTIVVPISALERTGLDELLEQVFVVAELEELEAVPTGRAGGMVIDSHLDTGRGPVATVLVQRGLLSVGDPLVAGAAWGRVRALINDKGEQVKSAGPSTPVQVLGLSEVARAGDAFVVATDEKTASRVADTRGHWQRQASMARTVAAAHGGAKLEDLFSQIQSGETATLNLILKADVYGSLEAVTDSLRRLEREDVKLAFVSRGVGGITENDIQLASTSNATILGFNVRPDRKARQFADAEGVEIRVYEIIYKLLEDIENAMLGLLEPEYEEVVTGEAEVREIFRVPRLGAIAGCYVTNGVITRNSGVRFLREGVIIWRGTVQSLRRFKDDAREVAAGYECGIGLSDFQDLRPGDVIETFEQREIPRV